MTITRKDSLLYYLVCCAALLAFCVVLLGAYTRLKDAGLGCPDWPGCYGHLIVPHGDRAQSASIAFGGVKIEAPKAWAEMTHRYLAGTLGTLLLAILLRAIIKRKTYHTKLSIPILLAIIVLIQASLGRFTVTLKLLPPIVLFHLLGGMSLFALLVLFALQLKQHAIEIKKDDGARFRCWAALGLLLLIIQIILGGWTSANYAALACTDFPYCNGQLMPPMHFAHAFTIADKIGLNYQGGLLDQATRITIQMTHRFGAGVVFIFWRRLSIMILGTARSTALFRFAALIILLLIIQVSLGVMNIALLLPLPIAVMHNGVAALLLSTIIGINYALYSQKTIGAYA